MRCNLRWNPESLLLFVADIHDSQWLLPGNADLQRCDLRPREECEEGDLARLRGACAAQLSRSHAH